MRIFRKSALALLVCLCMVSVGVFSWVVIILLNPGDGTVPMVEAPSSSMTSTLSPIVPLPSHSVTTLPSSSPVDTAPPMADIDGVLIHIEIRHGSDVLVNSDIVPIRLEDDGKLVPPTRQAGVYYSESEWNTFPGNLDTYRGIVAGHNVDGYGNPDVFFRLGEVREGDNILLTYHLNATQALVTAEFVVTDDAISAPKADVVNSEIEAYRHIWQPNDTPGRYLTVLSCDLATANPGQHAVNNWIVDAVRMK